MSHSLITLRLDIEGITDLHAQCSRSMHRPYLKM